MILALLAGTGLLTAQESSPPPSRSIEGSVDIESFRPIGELRLWTFFSKRKTFGQLTSIVKGYETIDGRDALILDENLQIDYAEIDAERKIDIRGQHYLAGNGDYLGSSYLISGGETLGKLELRKSGNRLEGSYSGDGRDQDLSVPFERDQFGWEANFVDQLEIILAMHDIRVGDSLLDSIFIPQSMYPARIVGYVETFEWQEIYKNRFDSVFVIHLSEPQPYTLAFTADKRLIKVDMLSQDVRVYQDMVRKPTAAEQANASSRSTGQIGFRALFFRIPQYIAYLLIALGSALLIAPHGAKDRTAWMSLLGGAGLFVLIPFTQVPLQQYLVSSWLLPQMSQGGSIYFWFMWPAIASGLVQSVLIVGTLFLMFNRLGAGAQRRAILGAFLGAGFGMIEAGYLVGFGISSLFAWSLLERGFFILFHTAAGAMIASATTMTRGRLIGTVTAVILTNSAMRYLPLFTQQGQVAVEVMHFMLAFITIAFLIITVLGLKAIGKTRHG